MGLDMARRTRKTQVTETPSERFERVVKRVLAHDLKRRLKSKNQPRWKAVKADPQ